MAKKRLFLRLAFGVLIFNSSSCTPVLAAPPNIDAHAKPGKAGASELMLKESSEQYGQFVTYVAADAIRLTNPSRGYEILCKAPDWKVYCFRRDDKLVFINDINRFTGVNLHNPFAGDASSHAILTSKEKTKFLGLPCTEYKYGPTKITIGDDSVVVNPRVAEFLCRFFTTPIVSQIPLMINVFHSKEGRERFAAQVKKESAKNKNLPWLNMPELHNFVTARSGIEHRLATIDRKEIPYSAKDFELPPNMHRVSQSQTIVFSQKSKDDLRDLVNDIGFTESEGDKKK